MGCLMGIDLGTSSTKALLLDPGGKVLGVGAEQYRIDSPRPGFAEQQPDRWWKAAAAAVSGALSGAAARPEDVCAIGFSGQMHGLVALDAAGRPVRPAILWADRRTGEQVRRIERKLGRDTLGRITGNRAATGFFLPSLLWIKEREPGVYADIATAVLPKDYLRLRFTGERATDVTDASASLAFDVGGRVWAFHLLEALGLDPGLLPDCGRPFDRRGEVCREAAERTGLRRGTPVFLGGGDQPMQAVGNGIVEPGLVSLNIGTGSQISSPLRSARYDRLLRTHTFCHAPDDTWYIMGASLNGGLALQWAAEKVLGTSDYGSLDREAAGVPAASEGLVFVPYLAGERCPHFDRDARGLFFGLTLSHGRAHMIRAVMEAVVFALRDSLEIMRPLLGVEVERIIASGGGAASPLWRQMQADILNVPVLTAAGREHACVGAALTAGVGAGVFSSYREACSRTVRWTGERAEPRPEQVELYDEAYRLFKRLYRSSRGLFSGRRESENQEEAS